MNRTMLIIVVFVLAYLIGARMPQIAQRFGLA